MKKHLPMTAEALAKATSIFNALQDRIFYLYERWQDEKEYEDFADYQKSAKERVEALGFGYIDMTKRPFAIKVQIDEYQIALSVTQKTYKWKRIA